MPVTPRTPLGHGGHQLGMVTQPPHRLTLQVALLGTLAVGAQVTHAAAHRLQLEQRLQLRLDPKLAALRVLEQEVATTAVLLQKGEHHEPQHRLHLGLTDLKLRFTTTIIQPDVERAVRGTREAHHHQQRLGLLNHFHPRLLSSRAAQIPAVPQIHQGTRLKPIACSKPTGSAFPGEALQDVHGLPPDAARLAAENWRGQRNASSRRVLSVLQSQFASVTLHALLERRFADTLRALVEEERLPAARADTMVLPERIADTPRLPHPIMVSKQSQCGQPHARAPGLRDFSVAVLRLQYDQGLQARNRVVADHLRQRLLQHLEPRQVPAEPRVPRDEQLDLVPSCHQTLPLVMLHHPSRHAGLDDQRGSKSNCHSRGLAVRNDQLWLAQVSGTEHLDDRDKDVPTHFQLQLVPAQLVLAWGEVRTITMVIFIRALGNRVVHLQVRHQLPQLHAEPSGHGLLQVPAGVVHEVQDLQLLSQAGVSGQRVQAARRRGQRNASSRLPRQRVRRQRPRLSIPLLVPRGQVGFQVKPANLPH